MRALARAAATAATFVAALVGSALLHLDLPAVRRAVVMRLDGVLAHVVAGRIVIERVGGLGPEHVSGVDARVEDAKGRTVLRVTGVSARVATGALLRSLASGDAIDVEIEDLVVASADVSLDADEAGGLRLAGAFGPNGPPKPPAPDEGPSRGVRISIPRARLGHARVHGQPAGAPPVDADVDGAEASVTVAPGTLDLRVAHAGLLGRDLPPGVRTQGTLDARYAQPAPGGGDRLARVTWRGTVGELEGTADAVYDGGRVDAVVDVPVARPECVRALWAQCPFGENASVHAEVHGAMPLLAIAARASIGRGNVTVAGSADVEDEARAALHVALDSFDARAVSATAPSTELAAAVDVAAVRTADGAAAAIVALDFAGGSVAGAPVPRASVTAHVQQDAAGALRAQADLSVREPGLPASGTVRLTPSGDSYALAFDVAARAPRLDDIPRLGAGLRGGATARAHGTVDLGARSLDAQVAATATGIAAGTARLDALSLTAHATGPLGAPRLDASVSGQGLAAGSLRFDTLRADARGTPGGADVHVALAGAAAQLRASAAVALGGGVTLRDVVVDVERNGETANVRAASVRAASGDVQVEDLRVDGLGSPLHATVHASPGALQMRAQSHGLDLARFGRLAGVDHLGGRVALDVDATLLPRSARGRVVLDVTQASFGSWGDTTARLDATLEDRRASGTFAAKVADVGTVDVKASSIEIGAAGPLSPAGWRGAWGAVETDAHVDLTKLSARLPRDLLPAKAAGALDVHVRVARDSASDATPDVDVTARTADLSLVGAPVAWRIDGLGASVHVAVDGRTGVTSVDAQASDRNGALASVTASSEAVPYARLFDPDASVGDALLAMPVKATLTVPERDLAKLPSVLAPRGMAGLVAARVDWAGAADRPDVQVRANVGHAHADALGVAPPLDLDLGVRYDGAHLAAALRGEVHGKPVADVQVDVDARAADLVRGQVAWKGALLAKLSEFPLQAITALDDRQVHGTASGTVKVDGLHDDARATVTARLDHLQVGDVACGPATMDASFDGRSLDGTARVAETDGSAEVRLHAGARWGAALAPALDAATPADVSLSAKHFRIAVLRPFVAKLFTELDGRLDGDARVHVDPAAKTVTPDATLALSEGVFELAALGNELHDAAAKVRVTPDGVVRIDDVTARGLSGHLEAAATARLQGLDLVGARGVVRVPSKEPLPLVVDGTQVGVFDGEIDVALDRTASGTELAVDVPTMRLVLPLESRSDVQALGPLKHVRTGVARAPGEFTEASLDADDGDGTPPPASGTPAAPMRVAVKLGKQVEVKRGTQLDVYLEGGPTLTLGHRVTATGKVLLPRGKIDVQGKAFTIDEGTISFVDDPTNPQVILRASWNAKDTDGHVVYAEFIGPLRTAQPRLKAEPALSQDEIISLLLFGTTDQTSGGANAQSSQQGAAAQGAAGNAASQTVNQALGGVNRAFESLGAPVDLATKVDTSQTTPRPEVEVQIARDITVQLAWVLGIPPPGSNPDTTLLTVSWRFLRKWSLAATVGNQGSSILDVVWQHRY